MMVEIYGLYDVEGALRYVGKAKDSKARFKRHLLEAKTNNRPVHNWIRKQLEAGNIPQVRILETVQDSEWQEAEKRLIALHRQTSNLLNVAEGGDVPHQTKEQRVRCAQTMNRKLNEKSTAMKQFLLVKQEFARMATELKKRGDLFGWWCMKVHMHRRALSNPKLFGGWLIHGFESGTNNS